MRKYFLLSALIYPILVLLSFSNAFAQTQIERISNAARSDGQGYVVRYHLTSKVDSFEVIQPAPDFIQMLLYKEDLDTTGIRIPVHSEILKDIRLYNLGYGYGVDLYLKEDANLKSTAYFDQNSTDLLLALTNTNPKELTRFTQQYLARNWYEETLSNDVFEMETTPARSNNGNYKNVKDKLRFDKVVIDAGHGGWDSGSIGYKGVKEKNITLAVAKKLGAYMNEHLPEVEVIYTRTDDTYMGLEELGHFANISKGDLYISIHCNAYHNSRVYGSEVYFLGLHKSNAAFEVMKRENSVFKEEINKELTEEDLLVYELAHSGYIATSEKIAYMIEDQFKNRAQRKSRGVKQAGFQVLFEASMPAVLVELGFITNPGEQRFLTSDYGQSIMASALFRAIRDYKEEYEKKQAYNVSTN